MVVDGDECETTVANIDSQGGAVVTQGPISDCDFFSVFVIVPPRRRHPSIRRQTEVPGSAPRRCMVGEFHAL